MADVMTCIPVGQNSETGLTFRHEPSAVCGTQVDQLVKLADVEVLVTHNALVHHIDPDGRIKLYSVICSFCMYSYKSIIVNL